MKPLARPAAMMRGSQELVRWVNLPGAFAIDMESTPRMPRREVSKLSS